MAQINQPDFKKIFESAPGLYLILLPDLTIVAVSNSYANATMTKREEILGKAATTDFAGDLLDELLWFDESFFLPETVTFSWSVAFTCRCWNWTTAFC